MLITFEGKWREQALCNVMVEREERTRGNLATPERYDGYTEPIALLS